jgi:copper chaperone CopZ
MLKVAVNYLRVEAFVDIDKLEMSSLKKLSTSVTYLIKQELLAEKKELLTVTGQGADYNNNLMIKIRAIKADIEPKTIEVEVSLKDAREVVAELKDADKEALLALLMEELGYEVEKVA